MNEEYSPQQEAAFLQWRLFTAQLVPLAERLAREAGEEPTRPLTAQQLLRAMQVLDAETELVVRSMRPVVGI